MTIRQYDYDRRAYIDEDRDGEQVPHAVRPYRCTVSIKCLVCSAVVDAGVVVPGEHYHRMRQVKQYWYWREAGRLLCGFYGLKIPDHLWEPA